MNLIGIDKTVIKNFIVTRVNMDKLQNECNIKNVIILKNVKGRYNYFSEQREDNFNLIKICDNEKFNTLKIDVKKIGKNSFIQYGVLDLSIKNDGSNLLPLNVKNYKKHMMNIFSYINERYGIEINTQNIKFENIELNATIELDNKFDEYINAFEVLFQVAPRSYKSKKLHEDRIMKEIDYMSIYNKSILCKFYNKSKQLKDVHNISVEKNILRVEYTILTGEKIKDIFASNELNELRDEEIKRFVKEKFQSDFIKRFSRLKERNRSKLIKIAKQYREEYKQWIKPFLIFALNDRLENNDILICDIEDLKEIIKEVDKKNFSRNWRQVLNNNVTALAGINNKVFEIGEKINRIE